MAVFDFLQLTPKSAIGDIEIAASLEEIHSDSLQVTEHPVELGAQITDHAFVRPAEVVLKCGWSNSGLDGLLDAASAALEGNFAALLGGAGFEGGSMTRADYVGGVYSKLLALQQSRIPFAITTSRRQYNNMLITGLQVTTDARTSNALMVTATCREIIIVNTQATTLPPREAQADPASTAEVENAGVKQVQPGTPSPGGALPPQ